MDLVATKVTSLLIMLVLTLAAGYLPLPLRSVISRSPRSATYLSATICFGAGILMATVFLHLMPEVSHEVDAAMADGFIIDTHYPISFLIICSGFFIMYLIDELVHTWVHMQQGSHGHHHHHHEDLEIPKGAKLELPITDPAAGKTKTGNTPPSTPKNNKRIRCDSIPSVAVLTGCDIPGQDNCSTGRSKSRANSTLSEKSLINPTDSDHQTISTLRSILVIVALSVHGCLEGLSMGLEDTTHGVWIMFGALSAHKIAIAFSIGMELLEKGVNKWHYALYMIIFSVASPIGGGIGGAISAYSPDDTAGGVLTVILLSGFSAGTILYVVFCEILERERSKAYGRIQRYISLLLGFILMACLLIVHTHDHGDHDHGTETDHDHDHSGHTHSHILLTLRNHTSYWYSGIYQ